MYTATENGFRSQLFLRRPQKCPINCTLLRSVLSSTASVGNLEEDGLREAFSSKKTSHPSADRCPSLLTWKTCFVLAVRFTQFCGPVQVLVLVQVLCLISTIFLEVFVLFFRALKKNKTRLVLVLVRFDSIRVLQLVRRAYKYKY